MGSRITGKTVIGYKYFMTMLMGLGAGPVDFVKKILIGDQTAWEGQLEDGQTTSIEKDNLFGGKKGEGGVNGSLTAYYGARDQKIPATVKAKINHDDPSSISDFRGTANLWWNGMICSMTWYPKTWSICFVRRKSGWDGDVWQPDLCEITMTGTVSEEIIISEEQIVVDKNNGIDDGDGHTGRYHNVTETIFAMNPIHAIYQLLTDRTWGRGYPRELIDDVSFITAATQCKAEGFGICYEYDPAQSSVAEAIGELLSTIGAGIYTDRQTGLLTIKLIRDDYDPDLLPVYTRDSGIISIERAQVATTGAAVNELHVSYYSPITNSTRVVCRTNDAAIMSLGYKVTKSVTYTAIPTAELAGRIGDRDLLVADPSIRRLSVKMDRRAWKIAPVSVIKINDPHLGIDNEIFRVVDVKDSTATDGTMTLSLATDQFNLPASSNAVDITPSYHPPSNNPTVVSDFVVQEASYRDAVLMMGSDDVQALDRNVGTSVTYAAQPTGTAMSYSVNTSANNGAWDTDTDEASFTEITTLSAAINEFDTTLTINAPEYMDEIDVGSGVQIDSEVMRVDAISDDNLTITVARGCGDTIPAAHAAKSLVVFLDTGYLIDDTEYGLYETVKTRIITNTATKSTDPSLAPTASITIQGRQGKPYPPANVLINGNKFNTKTTVETDMVVTWANRNRIQLQDKLIGHLEASQDLEADTVTYIGVYDGSKAIGYYQGTDTQWIWTKEEQIAALKDNPIPAGDTRAVTIKMGTRYQPAQGSQINSWQEYVIPALLLGTADYVKPNKQTLTITAHKATLQKHITGIVGNTARLSLGVNRANLRHHITGIGGNELALKIKAYPATIKSEPRIIPTPPVLKITAHKAALQKHVVSGDRLMEDGSSWRILQDDTLRDLEQ